VLARRLPMIMTRVWPIAMVQKPTVIYMVSGFMNSFRTIFIDGRPHSDPDVVVRSFNGESIGRWEKDTLVVDTKYFVGHHHWIDSGVPASDELHIVERIKPVNNGAALEIEYTLTDPKGWEGEMKFTKRWNRVDDQDIRKCSACPISTSTSRARSRRTTFDDLTHCRHSRDPVSRRRHGDRRTTPRGHRPHEDGGAQGHDQGLQLAEPALVDGSGGRERGKVVTWTVEMTAPSYLVRAGWKATTVKPGDEVQRHRAAAEERRPRRPVRVGDARRRPHAHRAPGAGPACRTARTVGPPSGGHPGPLKPAPTSTRGARWKTSTSEARGLSKSGVREHVAGLGRQFERPREALAVAPVDRGSHRVGIDDPVLRTHPRARRAAVLIVSSRFRVDGDPISITSPARP
jgi:hypothetical protein